MIIADTGFWIALADKKDKHHQEADDFAKTTTEKLISTYPVNYRSLSYSIKTARCKGTTQFYKNVSTRRV